MKIVRERENTNEFLRSVKYSMDNLDVIGGMNRFALILCRFEKAGMTPTHINYRYDGDEVLGPRGRSFDNYDEFVKKRGLLASTDLLNGISFNIHWPDFLPIKTTTSLEQNTISFIFHKRAFGGQGKDLKDSEIDKVLIELEKILESVEC